MKRIFTLSLLLLMCFYAGAQSLTFTGRDADKRYAQLNRVVVTNHSQGWQETLYWPDTTLSIENATEPNILVLSQNNPNPFNIFTEVNLGLAEAGDMTLVIADMNGNIVETHSSASLPRVRIIFKASFTVKVSFISRYSVVITEPAVFSL